MFKLKNGKWDWKKIREEAISMVEKFKQFETVVEFSEAFGIPQTTIKDALSRGDLIWEEIFADEVIDPSEQENSKDGLNVKKKKNRATIKYKSGEPLSKEELMILSDLDPDEWEVVSEKINAWQIGRKNKKVDLHWKDGKISDGSSVFDEGQIQKEYLFQIELKLTKKKRVPVKAILQPIHLEFPEFPKMYEEIMSDVDREPRTFEEVLFICDPHFGFSRTDSGNLVNYHDREFLGALLAIAHSNLPDYVVWNGDILDLPDMSSFTNSPSELFNTQAAGIELSWLMKQFNESTDQQVAIEGNHDLRFKKALMANFKAAFELKPIHDLEGDPMLSVPRFLGLDQMNIKWVDGYPDNFFKIGNVRFHHGKTVRKGSGRTSAYEIGDATVSRWQA